MEVLAASTFRVFHHFYYPDDGSGKLLRELRDYYQSTLRYIPKTATL
jgi:hypothetical protein